MFRKLALIVFLTLTVLAIVSAFHEERKVTTNSKEAYRHYLAGVDYLEKFYLRQATEELEKAVALDSTFAMAQSQLSKAYASRGFKKKAEEMRELASASRHLVSPREQMILDIDDLQWRGYADSAYALARELVSTYPNDLVALSISGYAEWSRGNWERSLELFQSALKVDPRYAPAYNVLGYLNFYLGRYQEALVMLDKYIEFSKDQANPHDSRGEILHAIGRYEEAIAEFRQAFNINPEFEIAVMHMAASYDALGQISHTDYCYQVLLSNPPNENRRLQYLSDLAGSMIAREEFDSAATLLIYVLENDPEIQSGGATDVLWQLYRLHYHQKRLDDLKETRAQWQRAFDKRIAESPGLVDDENTKRRLKWLDAGVADLSGDLVRAATLLEEIIDLIKVPTSRFSYRLIYADVLLRQGKHDLAVSELQKSLSINPNHAPTLVKLGDVFEEKGDNESAQTYRERALQVWRNADPNFKPLKNLLGKTGGTVADLRPSQRLDAGI